MSTRPSPACARYYPDGTRVHDIIDDPELVAQVEDGEDPEDEDEWLYQRTTPHTDASPSQVDAADAAGAANAADAAPAAPESSNHQPSRPAVDSSDEEDERIGASVARKKAEQTHESSSSSSESEAEAEPEAEQDGPTNLGGDRWLVETLLDFRVSMGVKHGDVFRKGTNLFKVRWSGCTEDEDSWEPKSKIAPELVAAYEAACAAGAQQPKQPPQPAEPAEPGPAHELSPPSSPSKRARQPASSPSAKSPNPKAQAVESAEIEELD